MVKSREDLGKEAEAIKKAEQSNEEPFNKLVDMKLKKDFETLKRSPINQPIVEFLEESHRLLGDIDYDNQHDLLELKKAYMALAAKEYNRDLPIFQVFERLKSIYEKQIFKLMEFPNVGAVAILEMYKIHNKTKGGLNGEGTD
jgi:hypothetical protein